MIHIKEAILVEGKYDKNILSQIVDALIITTDGFHNLSNPEFADYLRKIAAERGIILLTDSDHAGFQIRGRIAGILPEGTYVHAYIPELAGKEKRKKKPGKEGLLGVEGMRPEVIVEALQNAGMTRTAKNKAFTHADFYALRLIGFPESEARRDYLRKLFGIPSKVNTKTMMKLLSSYITREELCVLLDNMNEKDD